MYFFIFALGIIIGSFINVCIYRIPRGESVAFPPSHCTRCDHILKWYDLIPVMSFILLKGKCRYCNYKISLRYPIIEMLNGILYLLIYHYFGLSLGFFFYGIIGSILIIICFIDYYQQIIPDGLVLLILISAVFYKGGAYLLYKTPIAFWDSVLGFLTGGLLFLAIAFISNGAMGGGDIKLIAVLGFILGFKNILLNIFLAFVIGAVFSILLMLWGKKRRKDAIPFGPFINVSYFITLFYGESIIGWYIQRFFIG